MYILVKACDARRVLCVSTGRVMHSWCRRSILVARVQPVAMRRAVFCITCSLFVCVLLMEGDQMGVP